MFSGALRGNAGNRMVVNRYDSGCRAGGKLRFPNDFSIERRGRFGWGVCDAVYHKGVYTLDYEHQKDLSLKW